MEEINRSEGSSDEGEDPAASNVDLGSRTTVRKDILVANLAKGELGVVGVGPKVLHAMQPLAEASQRLA